MTTFDLPSTDTPISVLSDDQCWGLLEQNTLGRLITSVGERIDIVPVNYRSRDHRLLFRTAEGTKLAELTIHDQVVFEVDHVDDTHGWSVVVHGAAHTITAAREQAIADTFEIPSRLPAETFNYVEVIVHELTGRFVTFAN